MEFYPLHHKHRVPTQAPLSLLIFPLVPSFGGPLVAVGAALSFPFSSWAILFQDSNVRVFHGGGITRGACPNGKEYTPKHHPLVSATLYFHLSSHFSSAAFSL